MSRDERQPPATTQPIHPGSAGPSIGAPVTPALESEFGKLGPEKAGRMRDLIQRKKEQP